MNRRDLLRKAARGLAVGFGGAVGALGFGSTRHGTLPLDVDVAVEQSAELPVRLSATVEEPALRRADPARITLAVENVSGRTVTHTSGLPAPFGVLVLGSPRLPVAHLWSDAYLAESSVEVTRDGRVRAVAEGLRLQELAPGERVEETYRVRPSDALLRPGTFEVRSLGSEGFPREYADDVDVRVTLELAAERPSSPVDELPAADEVDVPTGDLPEANLPEPDPLEPNPLEPDPPAGDRD